jgi:hypothetical protein
MKAEMVRTGARVIGDRVTNGGRIERDLGPVSAPQFHKENRAIARIDMIDVLPARRIDIGKIDLRRLSGRYRQLRSDFCRAFLLSRTWSRKSNPARSHIRCSPLRGCFWKKRPATMFN